MKTGKKLIGSPTTSLVAVALMAVVAATTTQQAAAQALQGQVMVRSLSPQDIKDYSLTGAQGASGLNTVGVGQPAYLEAWVNIAIPASNITSVTWSLTSKPLGSAATLTASPLGTNVPIDKPSERLVSQVAGRTLLRPDVAGQYTVQATITTTTGSANVSRTINAGTYMGVNICALCHSGGVIAQNVYTSWAQTLHATFFTRAIDGQVSSHYNQNCISCHTVGYDANTNAINGGFDDVAAQLGWTFPATLTNGNWAAMPAALKNLANIQCESCHGPGSEHAMALGNTNVSNWPRLGVSYSAGTCGQCHDSLTHHWRNTEWENSGHAVSPRQTSSSCARCHTATGFARYTAGKPAVSTAYDPITCAACHDPHDAANPHQLRSVADVTLMDNKTTITKGGLGKLCMNCHMTRRDATNYVEVTAASSHFGPHYGVQADMMAGVNAVTYGKEIPSAAHLEVIEDSCVTCHMQTVANTNAAWTKVGDHTWKMKWDGGTPTDPTDDVYLVGACKQCHGPITSFNFKREDYDGDGVIDGVQTEVKHLLERLGRLLPPLGSPDVNTAAAGITRQQLRAAYNYKFVKYDGSYGVHNVSYAVGLLKASIADLTGDGNNDGLPDAWQIQYFGAANHPNAAPNAMPAGDGVPNWLKYALGLDPTVPGVVVPGGVVWANGKAIGGGDNTIQIYTAAEVVFDTEVGRTYQIQAVSSLSGGWQNVGGPIAGTGMAVSYVTPTRHNVQQFYRVARSP